MIFSSMLFIWLFLPVTILLALPLQLISCKKNNNAAFQSAANAVLLIASLIFYAWGEPIYIFLMLTSILISWLCGLLLEKLRGTGSAGFVLLAAVVSQLGILGYYKYAAFVVRTLVHIPGLSHLEIPNIMLPIGISFFTFQALSYCIDVYRGDCSVQKNLFRLALYISFFPQLIAGPIVRYTDINEQLSHRTLTLEGFSSGVRRFCYGFGKKVLVANTLALAADRIFALDLSDISAPLAALGIFTYMFQLYYDFSGYSDMAIGLGRMFGFEFRENFRYPYMAASVQELWQRWHISLSDWFKQYVYFPLGGNRRGERRTKLNLLIVFLLTGLWHGASYNYILWGIWNGLFSLAERGPWGKFVRGHKIFGHIYAFFIFWSGLVFFRIENLKSLAVIWIRLLCPFRYLHSDYLVGEFFSAHTVFILVCAVLGMGIVQRVFEKYREKWAGQIPELCWLACICLLSVAALATDSYNPFIYFRF